MIFMPQNCTITVSRKVNSGLNSAGEPVYNSVTPKVIYSTIPAYLDIKSGYMQYGEDGERQAYSEILYIQPRYITKSLIPQDLVTVSIDSINREIVAAVPKMKLDRNIDIYEVFLKIIP